MAAPVYYTAEMVRAIPDNGKRYEVVHGELLVTPSPREPHQRVLGRIHLALGKYLEQSREAGALYTSPADISSVRQDRFTKRRLYQEEGVATYWIVDCDARSVEVLTPEALFPQVATDALTWHPAGAPEPFTLPLEPLFRPL